MIVKRFVRIAVVMAMTAGLLALAQPAFALSSAPDLTWGTNGKSYALAQWGNALFVGGKFKKAVSPSGTKVTVANLSAFDETTGGYIPSFAPTVEFTQVVDQPEVDALAVSTDGSTLYVGGIFDTVNGQPRQNFAALDTSTGALNPNVTIAPNQKVGVIVATASLVYIGGSFDKIDGIARQHLAAISATTGSLSDTWVPTSAAGIDPCPSLLPSGTSCGPTSNGGTGNVHSMALAPDGASLFLGGNFFYVNGVPRNALARVSTVDGSLDQLAGQVGNDPERIHEQPLPGPERRLVDHPDGDRRLHRLRSHTERVPSDTP